MPELNLVQTLAVAVLPLLFAITLHEVAHGWVANRLGDPTARMLGRLSLNPLRHIDPVGTVLVPLAMLAFTSATFGTPLVFGWAKPVPVTWRNLRHPRRDMALVAAAGPGANLLMAVGWLLVVQLALLLLSGGLQWAAIPLLFMGATGVTINLVLMVLNLLPLPPLDGGRVVTALLPGRLAWYFARIEPYGIFILLVLLLTGALWALLAPIISGLSGGLFSLIGL